MSHPIRGALLIFGIAAGAVLGMKFATGLPVGPPIVAFAVALALSVALPWAPQRRDDMMATGRASARWAIALMGLGVSLPEIASLGLVVLPIVLSAVALTFFLTVKLARTLRVSKSLGVVIGAATAVCGASAALAVASTCGDRREETTYAIACATILGSIVMLLLMALRSYLHVQPEQYGLWVGASLHEVAHVLGATDSGGEARIIATITKIARILCLPAIIFAGAIVTRQDSTCGRRERSSVKLPGFLLWFAAGSLLVSLGLVPAPLLMVASQAVSLLLASALAGLAFGVVPRELIALGWRPLALAVAATVFITIYSALMVAAIS